MKTTNIVSVGIFFDGTGNNGVNATSSKKPPNNNESYYGAITNVYKLFNLFIGNQKKYIEGIGTLTGAEDSSFAMATCKNPVGYVGYSSDDKLAEAYAFIDEIMADQAKEYQFYVYGFSRGSMLARNFCYELLKPDSGIQGNIKVKFLGVFDTVQSTPFNDYNVVLLPEVENALHFCAVNECRYFFPLTGIFESSSNMQDAKSDVNNSVWKEIFIPGAHADVGGGYIEGPQSVYVSANYIRTKEVENYVNNVREIKRDSEGNKIWNNLLQGFEIDSGTVFSQAYVARKFVYNDLPKVYGRLMLRETNLIEPVFSTGFNEANFEINSELHPFLIQFSNELEVYAKDLLPNLKPTYNYESFENYTHISANFGLYTNAMFQKSTDQINIELINNGLNVPSHATVNSIHPTLKSKLYLLEDGSVTDFAYGSNIPNNDIWSRIIL